jgi:CheY-like chemotaxis protein
MKLAPRVLVVDDSTVARRALVKKLEGRFEVVEAASKAEACSVGDAFACAVLDLELGDGLGTEVARALHATRPGLPIAFFTSEPLAPAALDAQHMGPVFAKPAALGEVAAWVAHTAGAPPERG